MTAIVAIVRDDERPLQENMVLRSELLAGFVVTLDEPPSFVRARLRVRCSCGGIALEDAQCILDGGSGSFGPVACGSCRRVMLSVHSRASNDSAAVQVFAVSLAGGVPHLSIDRTAIAIELDIAPIAPSPSPAPAPATGGDTLAERLGDADDRVQNEAVRELGKRRDTAGLRDAWPGLRAFAKPTAIECLGEIADAGSAELLVEIARDPAGLDSFGKDRLVRALMRVERARAIEGLQALLSDADPLVTSVARVALVDIDGPRGRPVSAPRPTALEGILDSPSAPARAEKAGSAPVPSDDPADVFDRRLKRLTYGLFATSVPVSANVVVREGLVSWAFYLLLVVLVTVGGMVPSFLITYAALWLLDAATTRFIDLVRRLRPEPTGSWIDDLLLYTFRGEDVQRWGLLILALGVAVLVGIEAVYRAGPIYGWLDAASGEEGWWSR